MVTGLPENRRVLISGAGIAGLTLAYWLRRHGFEPSIVDTAPGIRAGGYMIDFWGIGYDVAERMDIIPQLQAAHRNIPTLDFVDDDGAVRGRMKVPRLRQMIGGRHFNFLRGDLECVLAEALDGEVPICFSRGIHAIHEDPNGVEVSFSDGKSERYDLLIGADGLRSNVRRLLFGPDNRFERYLGYYSASFTITDQSQFDRRFRVYSAPGKQLGLYPVDSHTLAAVFLFRAPQPFPRASLATQKERLWDEFASLAWQAPSVLSSMDACSDFYYDKVSQVRMSSWSRTRVALVGDACQCLSLISGQGSSWAMAGAYILANELLRSRGDPTRAFWQYQARLEPEIIRKQKAARRFAGSFLPSTRVGIWARNKSVNLMSLPFVSRHFIKRFVADHIPLDRTAGGIVDHSPGGVRVGPAR